MLPDVLFSETFLRGVVAAIAGTLYWVGGPVVAYLLYKRWRGVDRDDDPAGMNATDHDTDG
ncbi:MULTISPECIES: hypothetical protein [unclassified Haloparvum]|uniref:hypothetical protein n=1 Tax=Haloparvum sp. PAK95 TaxID=3418962 RepID=UPI003D2ECDB4